MTWEHYSQPAEEDIKIVWAFCFLDNKTALIRVTQKSYLPEPSLLFLKINLALVEFLQ